MPPSRAQAAGPMLGLVVRESLSGCNVSYRCCTLRLSYSCPGTIGAAAQTARWDSYARGHDRTYRASLRLVGVGPGYCNYFDTSCGVDINSVHPAKAQWSCCLTPRWSGRVEDKVPSSYHGTRAAQLNR